MFHMSYRFTNCISCSCKLFLTFSQIVILQTVSISFSCKLSSCKLLPCSFLTNYHLANCICALSCKLSTCKLYLSLSCKLYLCSLSLAVIGLVLWPCLPLCGCGPEGLPFNLGSSQQPYL